MTRYVIDAGILVRLVEAGDVVPPAHQLVAPAAIRSHALDLLLARVTQGTLDDREALTIHDRLTELKIRVLNDRVSRRTAWAIARDRGWQTVRDAEYLALATLQADALVTGDARLAAAAAGVTPVAPYDALVSP